MERFIINDPYRNYGQRNGGRSRQSRRLYDEEPIEAPSTAEELTTREKLRNHFRNRPTYLAMIDRASDEQLEQFEHTVLHVSNEAGDDDQFEVLSTASEEVRQREAEDLYGSLDDDDFDDDDEDDDLEDEEDDEEEEDSLEDGTWGDYQIPSSAR